MTDLAATGAPAFARAAALAADLRSLAHEHGLADATTAQALVAMTTCLVASPRTVFPDPPEYVRDLDEHATARAVDADPVRSTHGFFDVVAARASRRDLGGDALDLARLVSVLHWTVGTRGTTIAYDWRDAPQRHVPSAGGLSSTDVYVLAQHVDGLAAGSYYFDHRRGLVPISRGAMGQRVADLMPGQAWLSRAGAVLVLVANADRLEHKYQEMAFKLLMLDVGVTLGHAELVATALELRSCIVGGLPADELATLLHLDDPGRVPVATLALGTRTGA